MSNDVSNDDLAPRTTTQRFTTATRASCSTYRLRWALKIDGDTAACIEDWFTQGVRAGVDGASPSDSPYRQDGLFPEHVNKLALHWWSRGFSHATRLLRAINAEGQLADLAKVEAP